MRLLWASVPSAQLTALRNRNVENPSFHWNLEPKTSKSLSALLLRFFCHPKVLSTSIVHTFEPQNFYRTDYIGTWTL